MRNNKSPINQFGKMENSQTETTKKRHRTLAEQSTAAAHLHMQTLISITGIGS